MGSDAKTEHRRKKRKKRPIYVAESKHGRFSVTHFVTIILVAVVLIWVFVEYLAN